MKIFLDTMIYLHYQFLDDLDLSDIFGPCPHTILIPRITLREIDAHKNGQVNRLKERARKVTKKFEQWSKVSSVKEGVTVEILPLMPRVDFSQLGLNPAWNDDMLIASVIDYRNSNPCERVVLVTQDSGPRMTAAHF